MFKKFYWLLFALLLPCILVSAQNKPDSAKMKRAAFLKTQTVISDSLNREALKLAQPNASNADLNQAIANIMKGLHVYSKFRDTAGLVQTFDNLAFVYHLQKKYTQAKWFNLQSNSLSRDGRDTMGIIHSLINLASIKEDIKDFALAKKDLTEALALAKTQPKHNAEINAEKALVIFYAKTGDRKSATLALNRINILSQPTSRNIASNTARVDTPGTVDSALLAKQSQVKPVKNASDGKTAFYGLIVITALIVIGGILYYVKSKKSDKDKAGLS